MNKLLSFQSLKSLVLVLACFALAPVAQATRPLRGEDRGSNSGYPLSASTPVDSDHYYVIWVQAAGEAGADGWSAAWGSESNSFLNLTVPSISVHAY